MKDNTARVEEFFSGRFVECWRDIMPEEVTEKEADFLQQELNLVPAARVLDVPCGPGRHSCALAARGYLARAPDHRMEAIRVYREESRASLAEAKAAVESYVESLKSDRSSN